MESNDTNPTNGINVEAEKNILNNLFSTNQESPTVRNILKDDIKLPESLKFNTHNNVNHIQNIMPESLKFDLNIMSNFKNQVENIKNDVTSVQQQQPLESSLKHEVEIIKNNVTSVQQQQPLETSLKHQVENIQNQFNNTIHQFETQKQIPKTIDVESKLPSKTIPNLKNLISVSNLNELNNIKTAFGDSTKHIHDALKELENRVNTPKPSDSYEERVTMNPNNLIFDDRKQSMSEYPHWS